MGAIVFLLKKRFFNPLACKARKASDNLFGLAKNCRATLTESVPFLISCAVFLGVISLHSPVLLFCLLLGSLIAVIIQQIQTRFDLPKGQLIGLQILAIALQSSSMVTVENLAAEYAGNSGKLSQFMNQCLKSGTKYNIGFWDIGYSYEIGQTPDGDWIGTSCEYEFEYNP